MAVDKSWVGFSLSFFLYIVYTHLIIHWFFWCWGPRAWDNTHNSCFNDELLSGFTGSGLGCRHCHTEHFSLWTNQKYSRLCTKSVWLYLHNLGVDAEHLPTNSSHSETLPRFFFVLQLVNMHFYLHWFIFGLYIQQSWLIFPTVCFFFSIEINNKVV